MSDTGPWIAGGNGFRFKVSRRIRLRENVSAFEEWQSRFRRGNKYVQTGRVRVWDTLEAAQRFADKLNQ